MFSQSPGVQKALRAKGPAAFRKLIVGHHLMSFIGEPGDIASTASFPAWDKAHFMTGKCCTSTGASEAPRLRLPIFAASSEATA